MYLALLKLLSIILEAVDWIRLRALRYFANPIFQNGSGNVGVHAAKLPLSDWRYPITVVFALIEAVFLSLWQLFKWLFFFNTRSIFEFFLSGVKILIVLSVLSIVGLYGYLSGPSDPKILEHYKALHQQNIATALLDGDGNLIGALTNPLQTSSQQAVGSLYAEIVPPVYWDILDYKTNRQLNFNYQKTHLLDVITWRQTHYKGVSLTGLFNAINPFSIPAPRSLINQLAISLHGEQTLADSCTSMLRELCHALSSIRLARHVFPYLANNNGAEFKRWSAIHGSLRGFREDIAGLRATADVVFNKKPEQLSNAEQALMAIAQLRNEPLLATSDLGSLKNEAIAVSRELYAQAQPALATNIEQDVTNLNLNKSSTLKSVNGVVVSEQSKLVPRSKVKLGNFTELLKQRLINEYQKVGNQRIVSDAQVTLSVLDNTHFEENLVSRLGKLQTQCQNCGLNYKLGPKVLEGGALIQVLVADQEGQLVRHFKRGEVEERAIGVLSTIPAAVALSTLGNQPDTLFCNQAYRNLPSPTTELPKGLVNCDTLSKPGHSLSFQESIQARASLPLLYALRKQANAEQLQGLYRDFGFTDIRTKEGNASHGDQLAYEMSYGVVQSEPLHLLDMVHQLGDVLYGRSQSKAIIAISQFLVSDLEEGRRYLEFNKKSSAISISKNYLRTQEAKSSLRQLLTYDFNSKNGALKSLRNIENGRILLAKTGQSYTKQQTLRDHWLIASVLIRGRRYSVSAFVGSPTTDQKGLAKQLSAGALFRPIMAGIIDSLD